MSKPNNTYNNMYFANYIIKPPCPSSLPMPPAEWLKPKPKYIKIDVNELFKNHKKN